MDVKICSKCKTEKELDQFFSRKGRGKVVTYRPHSWCKDCCNTQNRRWYSKNINKGRERGRLHTRRSSAKLHEEVFRYYSRGAPKCSCCNVADMRVLTMDHIKNDGAEHRKVIGQGLVLYRWLRQNKFPAGFQVLCWNCHMRKTHYGHCDPNLAESYFRGIL